MDTLEMLKKIGSIAIFLLGLLLIFGNLSGNLGFTENSANYNSSEEVITDITSGTTNLTDKFGTIFTILGVLILITAVVAMVKVFGFGSKNKGIFSS